MSSRMASKAFRDKLETLIEEHLIPFSGSKQDELLDLRDL